MLLLSAIAVAQDFTIGPFVGPNDPVATYCEPHGGGAWLPFEDAGCSGYPIFAPTVNGGSRGRFVWTLPLEMTPNTSFRAEFTVQFGEVPILDLFVGPTGGTFFLAAVPTAGSGGAGLGYAGMADSIAIELDRRNDGGSDGPDGHVGVLVDGQRDAAAGRWAAVPALAGQAEVNVWVEYHAESDTLTLSGRIASAARPSSPDVTVTGLDLPGRFDSVMFGFTGAQDLFADGWMELVRFSLEAGVDSDWDGRWADDPDERCDLDASADPTDNDADGVFGLCDVCLGDDASGDADGDGICDNFDECTFCDTGIADTGGEPEKPRGYTPFSCGCQSASPRASWLFLLAALAWRRARGE